MKNVFLYIENQNLGRIADVKYRRDTPYQVESNQSYADIQKQLLKFKINFDFLSGNKLNPGDIVLVSNITPFFQPRFLTKALLLKKMLSKKPSGFIDLRRAIKDNPKVHFIPYLWESEQAEGANWIEARHEDFDRIATWNSAYIERNPLKYFELNLQAGPLGCIKSEAICLPSEKDIFLSTIINAKTSSHPNSGYTYRLNVLNWYARHEPERFHLFGGGWEKFISKLSGPDKNRFMQINKGTVENKKDVISRSKFYLCIENCISQNGYVTEKIFDAFRFGAVPIYLGPLNICSVLPSKSFINMRSFLGNVKELHSYLMALSDEDYANYLNTGRSFLAKNKYTPEAISMQIKNLVSGL